MKLDNKEGYPDVYKVDLPDGYDQVRFAAYNVQNEKPSDNGDATDLVTIPGNLMNPCYYGDSSDDVIYKGGNRGGYWDEAYTVRDPEKEAEQHNSKDVVDINEGTFTRNASTLYVNSTFYDYYTDYELNGKTEMIMIKIIRRLVRKEVMLPSVSLTKHSVITIKIKM